MEQFGVLAAYMGGRGWLAPGKRVRVALTRRLGFRPFLGRRRRSRETAATSFETVVRMYAAPPEETP